MLRVNDLEIEHSAFEMTGAYIKKISSTPLDYELYIVSSTCLVPVCNREVVRVAGITFITRYPTHETAQYFTGIKP